jgi:hypothetical protein
VAAAPKPATPAPERRYITLDQLPAECRAVLASGTPAVTPVGAAAVPDKAVGPEPAPAAKPAPAAPPASTGEARPPPAKPAAKPATANRKASLGE